MTRIKLRSKTINPPLKHIQIPYLQGRQLKYQFVARDQGKYPVGCFYVLLGSAGVATISGKNINQANRDIQSGTYCNYGI